MPLEESAVSRHYISVFVCFFFWRSLKVVTQTTQTLVWGDGWVETSKTVLGKFKYTNTSKSPLFTYLFKTIFFLCYKILIKVLITCKKMKVFIWRLGPSAAGRPRMITPRMSNQRWRLRLKVGAFRSVSWHQRRVLCSAPHRGVWLAGWRSLRLLSCLIPLRGGEEQPATGSARCWRWLLNSNHWSVLPPSTTPSPRAHCSGNDLFYAKSVHNCVHTVSALL